MEYVSYLNNIFNIKLLIQEKENRTFSPAVVSPKMFLDFLFSNDFKVQINPPEIHNIPSTDLAGITPVEKCLNSTPFRGQSKNTTVRKSMYRTVGG